MLSTASKLLFGIAAFAAAAAFGYQAAIGDRAGSVLLATAAGIALVSALAVAGAVGRDAPPWVPADAPAPEPRRVDPTSISRSSPWPFAMSLAVGLAAVGVALDPTVFFLGVGVAAIVGVAWLVQVWREHPSFTPSVAERIDRRLLAPLATPIGTLLIALAIAVGMSRVLLAIPKEAATAVAIGAALGLLAIFAALAMRDRVSSGLRTGLTAAGVLTLVAGGVVGASAGERDFHPHAPERPHARVVAAGLAFDADTLEFPAETAVSIDLISRDEKTVFHNIAVYTEAEGGEAIWSGKPIPGDDDVLYEFETPAAGTYAFVCDFHPNMKGEFIVEEAEEGSTEHEEEHE